MRPCFPQYFESKSRFLSYTVVAKAFTLAGHEIVNDMDECDAVLFSMCDAMEYRDLMRMRDRSKGKVLIVGGSYAFNFWSAKLYCDGVWVGEVYEMADCETVDDILSSVHCYTGGDELPTSSIRIDWAKVPIAQIAPGKAYYWGGTGCKNHCRFCFTSWTHPHIVNSQGRIQKARQVCKRKKIHLMISSNEYDNDPGASTFDMLLKDYLKTPVSANLVRCGIEFATDESRKRVGKPVTFDDMYKALQKAEKERVRMKWFHITGYDRKSDWYDYIDKLCWMLDKVRYSLLITVEFNNLQYQNYTPLYAERKSINPDNYATRDDTKAWTDSLRKCTKSVMVGQPSSFQRAAARMGVELATNSEQAEFWANVMVNPHKKLTVDQAYQSLFDTGVMDTKALMLNPNTGEIRVNERWT